MNEPGVRPRALRVAAPRWHCPTLVIASGVASLAAVQVDAMGRLLAAIAVLGLLSVAWLQRPGPLLVVDRQALRLRGGLRHRCLHWDETARARLVTSRRGGRSIALELESDDGSLPASVALWRLDAAPELLVADLLTRRG